MITIKGDGRLRRMAPASGRVLAQALRGKRVGDGEGRAGGDVVLCNSVSLLSARPPGGS